MLGFSPRPHVLSVNTLKDDIPAYRDAFSLLRVWANQRGYGEGRRTCIRGFEGAGPWWNAVLELLIRGEEPSGRTKTRRRPLGNGLSSYQLFKAALDFLCMCPPWQNECRLTIFQLNMTSLRILFSLNAKKVIWCVGVEPRFAIELNNLNSQFPPEEYFGKYEAVLVDSSCINVLAGVPLTSIEMVSVYLC